MTMKEKSSSSSSSSLLISLMSNVWRLIIPSLVVLSFMNCIIIIMKMMSHLHIVTQDMTAVHHSQVMDGVASDGSGAILDGPTRYRSEEYDLNKEYRTRLDHVDVFERPMETHNTTPNLYDLIGRPVKNSLYYTTKLICRNEIPPKFVTKRFYYRQPQWIHNTNKHGNSTSSSTSSAQPGEQQEQQQDEEEEEQEPLIPRVIHQSWFEPITAEKYPNLSRLQNSWIASGWEYRFWSNDTAARYVRDHFPSEVYEAYDALVPGSYKNDLFRYCLLFMEGGVWADVDVQLQSYLDHIVEPDVGFMIPRDMMGHGLHSAIILSAPGHPILAKAIEEATNRVRNRYTIADITGKYCPNNVKTGVLSEHPDLFLTGPGLLAYAMKVTLGFPLSLPIHPGPFGPELFEYMEIHDQSKAVLWQTILNNTRQASATVPGRTLILRRTLGDMGATRYTDIQKNFIIASTGFPDTYDHPEDHAAHYRETVQLEKLWGLNHVYKDMNSADEEIRIHVMSSSSPSSS